MNKSKLCFISKKFSLIFQNAAISYQGLTYRKNVGPSDVKIKSDPLGEYHP